MIRHFGRIIQNDTESSGRLQPCKDIYSCKQNATIISSTEQVILSNIISFIGENFRFYIFQRFQTPGQNIDFGLFKFAFKFEKTLFIFNITFTHVKYIR